MSGTHLTLELSVFKLRENDGEARAGEGKGGREPQRRHDRSFKGRRGDAANVFTSERRVRGEVGREGGLG